jgi:hypothetical protein
MRASFLAAVLITFLLICCSKKEKIKVLSQQHLPTQTFRVDPSRDTMIATAGRCKVSILKGTFEDKGLVDIEIKEALTMQNIVLAGLTTLSGKIPLQSGGMIYINGKQNDSTAKILKSIEVQIPAGNYNPDMKLFSGEMPKSDSINWENPELLLNREERSLTDAGQALFNNNCASCHSIDKDLAAPALAFVTERRCMEWLKQATRHPASLAKTDLCFKEQVRSYSTMMTEFPDLSDTSIEAIYSYIKKESEKHKYDEGARRSYDPCRNLILNDTTGYKNETKITSTKVGKIENNQKNSIGSDSFNNPDSSKNTAEFKKSPDEYYTFTINSFGWYNVDCYMEKGKSTAESELLVSVNGTDDEHLEVYLIIPSEKIFMTGMKNENDKYFFYQGNKIPLPQNKTAYILAIKSYSEKTMLGKLKFTTSTQQDLTVNMQENSNIEQEIKSMNLDNFEFEMDHFKTEKKLLINQQIYEFQCPGKSNKDSTTVDETDIMDKPVGRNK